jgi:hypothetical protein
MSAWGRWRRGVRGGSRGPGHDRLRRWIVLPRPPSPSGSDAASM